MSIYLVRHGQDEDNALDIVNGLRDKPLTEIGRGQALRAAELLCAKIDHVDAIYSSPLLRAYETADIIANNLNYKGIITDPNLVERDFGILTGKKKTEIEGYCSEVVWIGNEIYGIGAKGSEGFPKVYARAKHILKDIELSGSKSVIIVAHRDIAQMIQAAYNNWNWREGLNHPVDNADIVKLGAYGS